MTAANPPDLAAAGPAGRIETLLDETLADVHPLMAEAFFIAAVPQWFNLPLFSAMRAHPDNRDQGLIDRLTQYSFITATPGGAAGETLYSVRRDERRLLEQRWLARDAEAYVAAHRRALQYWTEHPDPDPLVQAQNLLYHRLVADFEAGFDDLMGLFRTYTRERRLGAASSLLSMAAEMRPQLQLLRPTALPELDALLTFMRARLAQLRGRWTDESNAALDALRAQSDLSERLKPYVMRTRGHALLRRGEYLAARDEFRRAALLFQQQAARGPDRESAEMERAYTLVALGDAHAGLADAGLGYGRGEQAVRGAAGAVRALFYLVVCLPLIIYLTVSLGRRAWDPDLWFNLSYVDWIVARLIVRAARHYRQAIEAWEAPGATAETAMAGGKLAELYLKIGDVRGARATFEGLLLLDASAVGEYRRAVLQVGLGEACIRQRELLAAGPLLTGSLAALQYYEDAETEARAHALLGEMYEATGATAQALARYREAVRLYMRQEAWAAATDVGEQARRLAQARELPAEQAALARQIDAEIPQRHYPVRYRHPATIAFERVTLAAMTVVIFLIPVLAVHFDAGSAVLPQITFRASPLLDPSASFSPSLSQGIQALNVAPIANPNVLVWAALALVALYLALATALGVALILWAPLRSLERAAAADTVRLDAKELWTGEARPGPASAPAAGPGDGAGGPSTGEAGRRRAIELAQARSYVIANRTVWHDLIVDESAAALAGPEGRLIIRGSTSWYQALLTRLDETLPAQTTRLDFSHVLLRSRMGMLYLITIAVLLLISVLSQLAPALMFRELAGTIYGVADIYPYLFLGLFVPPVWWFIVQPLRQRLHIDPQDAGPWWAIGVGLALGLLLLLAGRPWLTMPDIYPPLTAIAVLGAALVALVGTRRPAAPQVSVARLAVQGLALLAAAAMILLLTALVFRDARAYHYLVWGNNERDRALAAQQPAAKDRLLGQAVTAYSRAADLAQTGLLGADARRGSMLGGFAPQARHSLWYSAVYGRAVVRGGIGLYGTAMIDYQRLQEVEPSADLFASMGLTRQGLGTLTLASQAISHTLGVDKGSYNAALEDYGRALALDPGNLRYHLWRGVAYHGLGDLASAEKDYEAALRGKSPAPVTAHQPLNPTERSAASIGLGWIAFRKAEASQGQAATAALEEARADFADAAVVATDSIEAWLGRGYADYRLGLFNDAKLDWETGEKLAPNDARILISLGTLHWRLGSNNGQGCNASLALNLRQAAQASYRQSVDYFTRSLDSPGQSEKGLAYTHRTLGQLQYLLKDCPDYQAADRLGRAVDSYTRALALDPQNAVYWQMRGRLTWVWTDQLKKQGQGLQALKLLARGETDLQAALALDPVDRSAADYIPNYWLGAYYQPRVESDGPAGISAGLQALVGNDQATASEWIDASLQLMSAAQSPVAALTRGQDAANKFLAGNPTAAAQPVLDRIAAALGAARDHDPAWLFGQGYTDLGQGPSDDAEAAYRRALDAVTEGRLVRSATDAAVKLRTAQAGQAGPALALFRSSLPRLETLLDPGSILQAMKLGTLAVAVGDVARGADWYNRTIPDHGVSNDVYYNQFLSPKPDLQQLWTVNDDGKQLLDEMERQLPGLLSAQPQLASKPYYWNQRAWFKYHLGLTAFRAGREDTARAFLDSAQIDATRGYTLSASVNERVYTYLPQSAWGWYHIDRGDTLSEGGDRAAALRYYEDAFAAISPDRNTTAWAEKATAAFRAGLASFQVGQPDAAAQWYARGLAASDGRTSDTEMQSALKEARDGLKTFLGGQTDASVTASGADILTRLAAALPAGS